MLAKLYQTVNRVNAAAMAPFQTNLPLKTVGLLFLLALIVAVQWRLIVEKIEEYEP